MSNRKFTDEIISEEMAAILRTKSPEERWRVIDGAYRMSRSHAGASIARAHPDWDEGQINAELARRLRETAD